MSRFTMHYRKQTMPNPCVNLVVTLVVMRWGENTIGCLIGSEEGLYFETAIEWSGTGGDVTIMARLVAKKDCAVKTTRQLSECSRPDWLRQWHWHTFPVTSVFVDLFIWYRWYL